MASSSEATHKKPTVPPTSTRPSLSGTLAKLRKCRENPKKVQEYLVLIRKYFIKEKTGIDRLRHYGGVETLIDIILGYDEKCINIALSILGNICMDPKVQTKMVNADGITALGNVIESSNDADIVNRACRTLGNLAQNPSASRAIHEMENVITKVVEHLIKTDDNNFQLTLIRSLRLLAGTPAHRLTVLNEEGLRAVALCLKSEDEKVITAAYQGMLVLCKEFSDVCARQIVAADAPAAVLKHTSHTNTDIRKTAFNTLITTWMGHHEMRVGIGNAGGVPFFIEQINTIKDQRKRLIMANGLCLSCCEVVNRVRVKDNGGLPMFLSMLQSEDYTRLHDRLISALTCFLYDESGWEIMMKNGLVDILITHLKRVANLKDLVMIPEEEEAHNDELCGLADQDTHDILDNIETSDTSQAQEIDACPEVPVKAIRVDVDSVNVQDKPKALETEALGVVPDAFSDGLAVVPGISSDGLAVVPGTSSDGLEVVPDASCHGLEVVPDAACDGLGVVPGASSDGLGVADAACDDEADKKEKSNVTRYSVDSPTYKSVVDWTVDDYMSGPKNILESEHYQGGSPDRLSGYSSPSNYGPYSPLSISSLDLSPDSSPQPRSVSPPISSPEKRSPSSPESSSRQSSNLSPIWSPAHSSYDDPGSSQLSGPSSPDILPQLSSPLIFEGGSHDPFLDEALRYSSSDEDADPKDFIDISDSEDFGTLMKEESEPMEILSFDVLKPPTDTDGESVKSEVMQTPSTSSDFQRLNSDTSDTDASTESRKHKRTPLSSKSGTKRKRDVTPEMRKRIMLNVEKSTPSSQVNLAKMLSTSVFSKKPAAASKELPSDKKDRRRQTEYCLVMLIKKISCSADPTEHLIRSAVLGTLMDYVTFAVRPFSKCGRILVRLTKNTECFEAMILGMVPHLINDRLFTRKENQRGSKNKGQGVKPQPKTEVKSKPPEVMNRSMSSCTLKETTKVVSFHREVTRKLKRSTQGRPTKSSMANRSEAAQLKEALFLNLAFMAETPFGQGVVKHLLLTGTDRERMKTAVALSLICRSRSLQTTMYIDHQGFRYLIMAIEQQDDTELQRHTIRGLFTLASLKTNKFTSPTKKSTATPTNAGEKHEKCHASGGMDGSTTRDGSEDDIIFKMDDGSQITACRAKLSEQSDVFKAMLDGHYSEAGQAEVNMPGVSKDAFQIVVDYLHNKTIGESYDLDVLLEAHGLADRFILDDLTRDLCNLVISSHLQMGKIQKIFAHAVLHEAYWVMKQCMIFLLVDPGVSDAQRLSKFHEFLSSPEGGVVVDVIEDIFRY